ncbi:hypothetical protein JCM1841_006336 [Sporobolomyces salmonicolor]
MARTSSLKIGSLLLRTLSKPIANKIKSRAKEHDGFKSKTIAMAQFLHRAEMNLRVRLLGESPKHVRPLSESRAIETGANFISEGFLFAVAASIIIGETYRGKRAEGKRRDAINETLETHEAQIKALQGRMLDERERRADAERRERELEKIVEEVVIIGLKGGFGTAGELPPDWQRHLRRGELAQWFGTTERVLRDDDDDEGEDHTGSTGGSPAAELQEETEEEKERRRTGSSVREPALEEDEQRQAPVSEEEEHIPDREDESKEPR